MLFKSSVTNPQPLEHATIIPRAQHSISRQQISRNALKVLYRLDDAGYQAYLVGGGVRDLLLGLRPKDFDVGTNASPEQVRKLFSNSRIIGRRFRLVHIFFGDEIIEVATFRANTEQKIQSGRTGLDVHDNIYGNIEEDAWRRDFSVNALYYNIRDFSIVDFCDGMSDINAKKLRMIGDAKQRYREDPVRILRAIRFANKLNFTMERKTHAPIKEMAELLSHAPAARLFEEVLKLFHGGHAYDNFHSLIDYGIFQYLFPLPHEYLSKSQGAQMLKLLDLTFQNTDERIRDNKTVTPAFILAALLWLPALDMIAHYRENGLPLFIALDKTAYKLLTQQAKYTSIPKRLRLGVKEIWAMQYRLENRRGKKAFQTMTYPRFRAGFDFLLVRAACGDNVQELAQWWTEFQRVAHKDKLTMINKLQTPKPKRRKKSRSPIPKQPTGDGHE